MLLSQFVPPSLSPECPKSVLYLCVFPAALQIGSSVSSVCCSVVKSCLAFATPWTEAHQASMALTISQSLPKLMSIELVMPSNHLILCHLFSFCLQSFPATESFPMSWLFIADGQTSELSFSISPSNEYSGFLSLRIDWFDDLSRFHIYALIYNICFSLSNFTLYNKL